MLGALLVSAFPNSADFTVRGGVVVREYEEGRFELARDLYVELYIPSGKRRIDLHVSPEEHQISPLGKSSLPIGKVIEKHFFVAPEDMVTLRLGGYLPQKKTDQIASWLQAQLDAWMAAP
jgi:hypothetical protein